eukprot:2775452-Rhodomonas_salina.1
MYSMHGTRVHCVPGYNVLNTRGRATGFRLEKLAPCHELYPGTRVPRVPGTRGTPDTTDTTRVQ